MPSPPGVDVIVAAIVVAGVLAALGGWFWFRLRSLGNRVGSFPCAVRTDSGWASGIACYTVAELRWYRVVSLSLRPRRVWRRGTFTILAPARPIESADGLAVGARRSGLVEVECRVDDGEGERPLFLAMSRGAAAGLASWLESAPPGAGLSRANL